MIAHHFLISSESGLKLLGHALLCPAARYASVRWREADRLDRRIVPPDAWPNVVAELKNGWTKGIAPRESVTYAAMIDRQEMGPFKVQKLTEPPFVNDVEAATAMDAYLKAQLFEAR